MDRRELDNSREDKAKKGKQEFTCGEVTCNKLYHSYTAFYNHCKKAHNGEFPHGSLLNNQYFDGPTKNRGRPRIKKSQIKNQYQIESMKAENQLIEFLGTIKSFNNRGNEELISFVEYPAERMEEAVTTVKQWIKDNEATQYFQSLIKINEKICNNDLPEFYDPIQHEKFKEHVDSYNFGSIFRFMNKKKQDQELADPELLLLCWLCRILSLKLFSETIFTILQRRLNLPIVEKDLYLSKSTKFFELIDNYLQLVESQNLEQNCVIV